MARKSKADILGQKVLLWGTQKGDGGSGAISLADIMEEAKQKKLDAKGIQRYNQYVRFNNTMELLFTKTQLIYESTINGINKMQRATLDLIIYLDSIEKSRQLPLIMTPAQYEAWKDREPTTEAEKMDKARADLYGVAILERDRGLCINQEGEYKQPFLYAHKKAHNSLHHYSTTTDIYEGAWRVSRNLIQFMNYNKLIEIMADKLKLKEFTEWQIDLSPALDKIREYNENIQILTHTQMQDNILNVIYTAEQLEQLAVALKGNLLCIDTESLEPQETEESQEALKAILENLPNFSIYPALTYIKTFNEVPDPIGAIELLIKEEASKAIEEAE